MRKYHISYNILFSEKHLWHSGHSNLCLVTFSLMSLVDCTTSSECWSPEITVMSCTDLMCVCKSSSELNALEHIEHSYIIWNSGVFISAVMAFNRDGSTSIDLSLTESSSNESIFSFTKVTGWESIEGWISVDSFSPTSIVTGIISVAIRSPSSTSSHSFPSEIGISFSVLILLATSSDCSVSSERRHFWRNVYARLTCKTHGTHIIPGIPSSHFAWW